jgi:hypothetical protein
MRPLEVVTAILCCSASLASAQDIPPEVKVLEKRVGVWNTETTINKAEWTPQAGMVASTDNARMTLKGRYLESSDTNGRGGEGKLLATYDINRKAYRLWYFDAVGNVTEFTGQYDEKEKTLTWTGMPQPGAISTARWKFLGEDKFEWDLLAKNAEGKVLLDMKGNSVRKK